MTTDEKRDFILSITKPFGVTDASLDGSQWTLTHPSGDLFLDDFITSKTPLESMEIVRAVHTQLEANDA